MADFLMMTLPHPRIDYYQYSDYNQIHNGIVEHSSSIADDLGFFPISMDMGLLDQMQLYSLAILFMGLIFDIIELLFVILSVLLIYSLLMIMVESKSFEFGVMRMVGLSKSGIVSMILLQSFMFVLPSVVLGFVVTFPTLIILYSKLFDKDMGVDTTPVPSWAAVVQASIVGLVIPALSAILPIQ